MKNIFLLPTDKPSRLLQSLKVMELLDKEWLSPIGNINRNIYIISEEEIKEGDFVIKNSEVFKVDSNNAYSGTFTITLKYAKKYLKKIILTTDPELIKNGVQAVDDNFLEWFVKNPGCVSAENCHIKASVGILFDCEKPKQEDFEYVSIGEDRIKLYIQEPKQNNIEDAALNFSEQFLNNGENSEFEAQAALLGVKFGAKWQSEKMYSEKEVRELLIIQRGNCYVAISNETNDEQLAKIAMNAPEPNGGNWIKNK